MSKSFFSDPGYFLLLVQIHGSEDAGIESHGQRRRLERKSLFLFALERQERRSRTDEVMSSIALHALDWIELGLFWIYLMTVRKMIPPSIITTCKNTTPKLSFSCINVVSRTLLVRGLVGDVYSQSVRSTSVNSANNHVDQVRDESVIYRHFPFSSKQQQQSGKTHTHKRDPHTNDQKRSTYMIACMHHQNRKKKYTQDSSNKNCTCKITQ
jgi:hypothetical protein